MNFYKRTLKNVDSFQNLSEEQKERQIYLYKHKFLPWVIMDMFTVNSNQTMCLVIILDLICIACLLISYFLKFFYLMIFAIIVIPILIMLFIVNCYIQRKLDKKDEKEQKKFIDEFCERISNIYLWNFKVISLRTWISIKKYKEYYRYLRSSKCNNKCYATSRKLVTVMLDPKVKLLWLGVVGTQDGHKFGHSVLRKGNWIYDSNLRRTYKAKLYIECYQAEIFKEFEINEYMDSEYMSEIWNGEFKTWCDEKGIKRAIED